MDGIVIFLLVLVFVLLIALIGMVWYLISITTTDDDMLPIEIGEVWHDDEQG